MITAIAKALKPNNGIIGLQIRALPVATQRNIHLALLLDTSGSMDGARMSALKRTLTLLVDRLKPEDALTLIEYNSVGAVRSVAESDKPTLRRVIEKLEAGGGTCLQSGINQLTKLVAVPSFRRPDAVFLMTDGQINQGIKTGEGLSTLLAEALKTRDGVPFRIPVSTVGYGEDHNAALLQMLAVATRGTYTFADSDEMLPAVIGNIMAGCEDEVARGLYVHLPAGTHCLELGARHGDETYLVGSIVAEKDQWVVLETGSDGAALPESLTIRWNVPDTSDLAVTELVVPVAAAAAESGDPDPNVMEQWLRAKAVRFIHTCNKHDRTLAQANLEILECLEAEIRGSSVASRSLMHHMLAELSELRSLLLRDPSDFHELNRSITRLTSDMTAMGMQRGILHGILPANPAAHNNWTVAPDPVNSPFFSPRQRETTESMTYAFSQQSSEDPVQ